MDNPKINTNYSQPQLQQLQDIVPKNLTLKGNIITISSPPLKENNNDVLELFSDKEIIKYLPHFNKEGGWTYDEIEERRLNQLNAQQQGKNLSFHIFYENNFAGICGFRTIDLIKEGIIGEIGIILSSKYWGKGIATEAYYLMLDYVFDKLNFIFAESCTAETNFPMLSFHKKFGFKFDSVFKVINLDFHKYIISRSDWSSDQSSDSEGKGKEGKGENNIESIKQKFINKLKITK